MRKGRLLFCILVGMFLVSFVSANNVTDYTEKYDFDVDVTGVGVEAVKADLGTKFTFGEDGSLSVGNSKFENIVPNSEGATSEVVVGKSGEIVSCKFIVNENGGDFTVNGIEFEAPPGSIVSYDLEKGVFVGLEGRASLNKMPIVPKGESFFIFSDNLTLPNGYSFSGGMSRDLDGWYLIKGTSIVVDGVSLTSSNGDSRVYFDGKEHMGTDYVSFGDDNFISYGNVEINFKEANKYVKIDEGDVFFLKGIALNSKINLKKGDSFLVPTLTTFGDVEISQDSKNVEIVGSDIILRDSEFGTSTPMKIIVNDVDGKYILGKLSGFETQDGFQKGGHELFVDNFNRFAVVPTGVGDDFNIKYDGIDTKFSSRVSYNYITDEEIDLLADGKILFDYGQLSKGEKDFMLGRTRDYWNSLTDENKNSISGLHLLDAETYKLVNPLGLAHYNKVDHGVYFNQLNFSLSAFRHEMVHARSYDIKNKVFAEKALELESEIGVSYNDAVKVYQGASVKISNLENEKIELGRKNYFDETYKDEDYKKDVDKIEGELSLLYEKRSLVFNKMLEFDKLKNEESDFNQEWEKISSFNYVGNDYDKLDDSEYKSYGIYRPYGAASIDEHQATIGEMINDNDLLNKFVNPNSKDYNSVYLKYFKLMYDNEFISKEEYSNILKIANK